VAHPRAAERGSIPASTMRRRKIQRTLQ
jgi:hypothetical protein